MPFLHEVCSPLSTCPPPRRFPGWPGPPTAYSDTTDRAGNDGVGESKHLHGTWMTRTFTEGPCGGTRVWDLCGAP